MSKSITILDYQARMIEELRTLQDRIVKLSAFMTANAAAIAETDYRIMQHQYDAMRSYETALNMRVCNMIKECWINV